MAGMTSSMPSSFSRIVAVSLLVLATGCGSSVAPRPAARVSSDTVEVRGVAAGEPIDGTATPAPTTPPSDVETSIEHACPLHAEDALTNLAMKEAAAAQIACQKGFAAKELGALLATLPAGDTRATRATNAEAAYASFVRDVCWASEEVQWVDLADGTRDDGTLRGYAGMACESRMTLEHATLLHAMRTKDARGFAQHVDDAAPRGRRETFLLEDLVHAARALDERHDRDGKAKSPGAPVALDKAQRAEYVKRFVAIEHAARALAADTCARFDGLAPALGGSNACVARTTTAYLALGSFEANGEDAGP